MPTSPAEPPPERAGRREPDEANPAVFAEAVLSGAAPAARAPESVTGSAVEAPVRWDALDEAGMAAALDEARAALALDEVPIGAVVVVDGRVVGRGHNRTRTDRDPTAHAELIALRDASKELGAARLVGASVYSTVEPCFMCAGALAHARAARVVWAVRDPKFGGCASLGAVLSDPRANHRARLAEGLFAEEARDLMQGFFRRIRAERRAAARDPVAARDPAAPPPAAGAAPPE